MHRQGLKLNVSVQRDVKKERLKKTVLYAVRTSLFVREKIHVKKQSKRQNPKRLWDL